MTSTSPEPPPSGRPLPRAPSWALVALVFATFAIYVLRPIYNIDIFWHLELGEVIAERGEIPERDLFNAVHPDREWVQFQWLYDLLAHLVDRVAGFHGLKLLNATVLMTAFAGLFAFVRRRSTDVLPGLVVISLLVLLFANRIQVRPHTFNLAFMVPLLPLVFPRQPGQPRPPPSWRQLAGLCGLAMLWAALHAGGSLLLPATLLAVALGETLNRRLRIRPTDAATIRRLWLAVGLVVLVQLLTPGFVTGLLHFRSSFELARDAVFEEWTASYRFALEQPHPAAKLIGLSPYLLGLAWLALRGFRWRRRGERPDLAETFTVGGYLLLAHDAIRLAFLGIVPAIALVLAAAPRPRLATAAPLRRRVGLLLAFALLFGLGYHYLIAGPRGGAAQAVTMAGKPLEPGRFPTRAGDFLAESGLEGGIFNYPKWGGYLVYRTWPACRVFIDGRAHVTTEMLRGVMKVTGADGVPFARRRALESLIERYGLDLVVFQRPFFTPERWDPDRYVLVFRYGDTDVYVVRDRPTTRSNLERAASWYAERGIDVADPLADPVAFQQDVRDDGARRWFEAPRQQRVLARLVERVRSTEGKARYEASSELFRMLLRARRFDEAERLLDEVRARRSDDPSLTLARARLLLAAGRDAELVRLLEPLEGDRSLPASTRRMVRALLRVAEP